MKCPSCGAIVSDVGIEPGSATACTHCGSFLVVGRPAGVAPPAPPPAADPATDPTPTDDATPPPPPRPAPRPASPTTPPTSAWATTAAIFGMIGYLPGVGLLAIFSGFIALFAMRGGRRSGLGGVLTGLLLGFFWTFLHASFFASWAEPYLTTRSDPSACEARVRDVGAALGQYRKKHGHEAESLHLLIDEGFLTEVSLRCPTSDDEYILRRYDLAAEDDLRLHESRPTHGPYRVILDFDRKVERRPESDFEAEQMARDFLMPK